MVFPGKMLIKVKASMFKARARKKMFFITRIKNKLWYLVLNVYNVGIEMAKHSICGDRYSEMA